MLSERNKARKNYTLYHSIYIKFRKVQLVFAEGLECSEELHRGIDITFTSDGYAYFIG